MDPAGRSWDADVYHRVSGPQVAWAASVLDRLELRGDEVVLDAGCGPGRVTRLLLERLPRGRVIAVDASPEMIARARTELAGEPRAEVREADLAQLRLAPAGQVDAVFSNATFHWVPDHDALFAALAASLKPGGRLSAQCGGAGNVAALLAAAERAAADCDLEHRFAGWRRPWTFAGPDETEARLRAAGFEDVRCWLQAAPAAPDEPRAYVEAICLEPHLERLYGGERDRFLEAVMARLGERPVLDYVRLNIVATRSGAPAAQATV